MWFIFFLAEQLKMTVGELLNTMTITEFAGWIAYYKRKHQS